MRSPVHLLEIDLLRRGKPTVVAPIEKLAERGIWDYLVCLSRGNDRDHCQVWAITVRQKLPRVLVPLAGDDPDVILDLQAVFNQAYDASYFNLQVKYSKAPTVPLSRADAKWSKALLREKRLRP
jgi:hypothetical protein